MAPPVKANTTVTLTMDAAAGGYSGAVASASFTVTPYQSQYTNIRSKTEFNLAKYLPYIVVLAAFGLIDVALLGLFAKRRWLSSGKPRSPQ
jgi:hypothetical protein